MQSSEMSRYFIDDEEDDDQLKSIWNCLLAEPISFQEHLIRLTLNVLMFYDMPMPMTRSLLAKR